MKLRWSLFTKILMFLAGVLIVIAGLYGYTINNTARTVQKELQTSHLNQLEFLLTQLENDIDQLALKAVLDGFAALAFAASFGVGVLLSAVSVAVVQGLLTLVGVLLGSVVPDAHIAALTATGGLMLVGIGLRLLRIREVPVGDMLPALIVAPLLTELVVRLR